MRLKERFPDTDLGRTIPYCPAMRWICGSVNAAILLIQLLFWTGKQADGMGWIYKSAEEITLEIGLTYCEQKTARARLRKRGLIAERYRRSEHTFFFKVNEEAVKAALVSPSISHEVPQATSPARTKAENDPESTISTFPNDANALSRTTDMSVPERHNARLAKGQLRGSLIGTTEMTQEKTQEMTQDAAAAAKGDSFSQPQRGRDEATAAFESALSVQGWPWGSTPEWQRFADLVSEVWLADEEVFRRFARWMEREGRYVGVNALQIRKYPQQFLDTAWPMYSASRRDEEREGMQVETPFQRRLREGLGDQ